MGTPHNPQRYGETWPQERIDASLQELEKLKDHIVLSGGWAWHFLSPIGHTEYKHIHDHKDIDVFVLPADVWIVIQRLEESGFKKVKTKYDKLPSEEDFRRYEKAHYSEGNKPFKITIDFFVKEVPNIEAHGWKIVETKFLLSLYLNIHSSGNCFAVQAAVKLLEKNIDPLGREELVQINKG